MIILLLLLLQLLLLQLSASFPAPNTANNRVLGFILAFDYNHIDPLMLIFNEYVSMCEAGQSSTTKNLNSTSITTNNTTDTNNTNNYSN